MNDGNPPQIFINYRRALCFKDAQLIMGELGKAFGLDSIFLDRQSIEVGEKWEDRIMYNLKKADFVLVLLPKGWLLAQDSVSGERKLSMENDWVRKEIRYALEHNKTIIPILIEDGIFPLKIHLPEDIQALTGFQNNSEGLRMENVKYEILPIIERIKKLHGSSERPLGLVSNPGVNQIPRPSSLTSTTFFDKEIPHSRYCRLICNRDKELIQLKDHLGKNKNKSAIHYFIGGRVEDRIDSLIERFVLDINKDFDVEFRSVSKNNEQALVVEELPITFDLEGSKAKFKSYFKERLGIKGMTSEINALSDIFDLGLPVTLKDYCVFAFRIDKNKEHRFLKDFIKWIIEGFCNCQQGQLKCLFFFTFKEKASSYSLLPNFFKKKKQMIVKHKLNVLLRNNSNCFHLTELSWVHEDDIIAWFDRYTNQTISAQNYINEAKQNSRYQSYYDSKSNSFSMIAVEELLQIFIQQNIPSAIK